MGDPFAQALHGETFPARVHRQQLALADEITQGRVKAHAKHGAQSIEAHATPDRLLAILTEELGEVATEVNDAALGKYSEREAADRLRAELVDVLTVASAWVAKLDRAKTPEERVQARPIPDNPQA